MKTIERALLLLGLAALVSMPALTGAAPLGAPAKGAANRHRETVVTLSAVGDVMFGRYNPDGRYRPFGLEEPFRLVKALWEGRDIVLCNLETPVGPKAYAKPYRGLTFRAEPRSARLLREAGFTLAVTANNHAFDQKDQGVKDTIAHLSAAGLGVAGTGATREEAFAPYVFQKRGVKVAVMGVTLLRNYTPKEQIGFHAYLNAKDVHAELPRRIREIRARYDFFVLSIHFGVEYYQTVSRFDRTLMDKLQAAGVDVVIGHHPHVLRPVEHRGPMVVFYSLGNFLFDYEMKNTGNAGVAELELVKRGDRRELRKVRFVPVYRHWRRIPVPATGAHGKRIRAELQRIGAPLKTGTRLLEDGEALSILPPS
ncbi:MAG: CapA family protein [Polyangia bacterium]|jgi:poly-gamma-glutamate synthesis protein (capsule biosynthesis protein)|nr:CapA family protein [Polyangia bacterium]